MNVDAGGVRYRIACVERDGRWVAHATRVQAEAARQGSIYHMSGPMAFARDAAMRLLGGERLGARYDWLYRA